MEMCTELHVILLKYLKFVPHFSGNITRVLYVPCLPGSASVMG